MNLLNNKKKFFTIENIFISLIILFIIIFFIPGLFQIEKMLYDDVYSTFTRMIGTSRIVKNGEMPLWDKNIFCGARPYYAMMEGPGYNVLLYPFFLLSNPENADQSFLTLYVLPFFFFMMLSVIGTYLFATRILKLSKLVSLLTGFIYIVSPAMTTVSFLCIHDQLIHIFLPWTLWAVFSYINTHKLRWWLSGIGIMVLMLLSFSINYTIRAFFILGFITFIYCLIRFSRKKIKIMTMVNALLIYVLSTGLASFLWLGIFEGVKWLETKELMGYAELVEGVGNNLYPGHLVTLFIPDYHGLSSCSNTWGNSYYCYNGTLLSGGFFTALSLFIYFIFMIKRKKDAKVEISTDEKIMFWIFFSLQIVSLLVMMGKFTPFFFIAYKLLPWFFRVPYPYYYQIAQNFSFVIVAGLSINFILKSSTEANDIFRFKYFFIYLALISFFMLLSFIEPLYDDLDGKNVYIPAVRSLTDFNEWGWFLTHPVLYLGVSIVLFFSMVLIKKEIMKYLLLVLIITESFYFGYINLYKNTVFPERIRKQQVYRNNFSSRFKKPSEYPLLQNAEELKNYIKNSKDPEARFAGKISVIDNLGWVTGGYSSFGYDSKPITKEMYNIVNELAENYPYELTLKKLYVNYFRNMNIKYLLFLKYQLNGNKLIVSENEGKLFYENTAAETVKTDNSAISYETYFTQLSDEKSENDFSLFLAELEEPLPYIYTQDRLIVKTEEEQFNMLLNNDLKYYTLVFQDDLRDNFKSAVIDNEKNNTQSEIYKKFSKLQSENKIIKTDRSKSNVLTVEIDVEKPSMLVRAETFNHGWKVKIDGKKGDILKVNFFQQGVWLEKGHHIVKFYFLPESVKLGLIISLAVLAFIFLYLFISVKKINRDAKRYLHDTPAD